MVSARSLSQLLLGQDRQVGAYAPIPGRGTAKLLTMENLHEGGAAPRRILRIPASLGRWAVLVLAVVVVGGCSSSSEPEGASVSTTTSWPTAEDGSPDIQAETDEESAVITMRLILGASADEAACLAAAMTPDGSDGSTSDNEEGSEQTLWSLDPVGYLEALAPSCASAERFEAMTHEFEDGIRWDDEPALAMVGMLWGFGMAQADIDIGDRDQEACRLFAQWVDSPWTRLTDAPAAVEERWNGARDADLRVLSLCVDGRWNEIDRAQAEASDIRECMGISLVETYPWWRQREEFPSDEWEQDHCPG